MFSIHFNSHVKSWRNQKGSAKNKKNSFINKYNWEGMNNPSEKNDWKNLKKIM